MIPIPIELVGNLISEGGWPLMIDQWPILIPMNTNTNINTNTNDPNTNRAGEEFDQWRWMTLTNDQAGDWKGETRENGSKWWMIFLLMSAPGIKLMIDIIVILFWWVRFQYLTNLISEKVTTKRVNIDIVARDVDQPHEWEGDKKKSESNATDSRLQQLHAVMSNEVWLAHHNAISLFRIIDI